MAKLTSRIFKFVPSTSPDVVAYRVYVDAPGAVTYTSPSADVTDLSVGADGKIAVDLAGLAVTATADGVYDVGVASVDDAGNESDIAVLAGVTLDFTAPSAPTELEIV